MISIEGKGTVSNGYWEVGDWIKGSGIEDFVSFGLGDALLIGRGIFDSFVVVFSSWFESEMISVSWCVLLLVGGRVCSIAVGVGLPWDD